LTLKQPCLWHSPLPGHHPFPHLSKHLFHVTCSCRIDVPSNSTMTSTSTPTPLLLTLLGPELPSTSQQQQQQQQQELQPHPPSPSPPLTSSFPSSKIHDHAFLLICPPHVSSVNSNPSITQQPLQARSAHTNTHTHTYIHTLTTYAHACLHNCLLCLNIYFHVHTQPRPQMSYASCGFRSWM